MGYEEFIKNNDNNYSNWIVDIFSNLTDFDNTLSQVPNPDLHYFEEFDNLAFALIVSIELFEQGCMIAQDFANRADNINMVHINMIYIVVYHK